MSTSSLAQIEQVQGWTIAAGGDDEPRVGAFDIAKRAGLKQPRNIKGVVDENRAELEEHGAIHVRIYNVRIPMPRGGIELREVEEPMLNEEQAINLVSLMRTKCASQMRVSLIKVFVAWRRGHLMKPAVRLDESTVSSSRISDDPAEIRRLRLAVGRVRLARGYSVQRVYGFIRRTRKVSSPFAVSSHLLRSVEESLEALETGTIDLGSSSRRLLPVRAAGQLALFNGGKS